MASLIDATKPVTGTPTTQSVRDNFATAKSEIEALQTGKSDTTHGHGITDIAGLVAALSEKATPADIANAIAALVDTSPAALDTLNELAAALGDDPNFATTITNALAAKAAADHNHTGTYEPAQTAASQVEMEAGTEAALRSMSPLRVKQAITALGGAGLPVADTTALVKGSADATKMVRMEVDGLTAGTTRVLTVPDRNLTLAGTDVGQTFSRPQKAATLALTHNTAWDGSLATGAQHLTVNVNGSSFTIANPSAQEDGMVYMVYVAYTTAHSIAWGTAFKGLTGVTATATAGAVDTFLFRSNGANLVRVGYSMNGGA